MKTAPQNSDQVSVAAPQPSFTHARGQSSDTVFEPLLDDERAAQFLGGIHHKTLQRMVRNVEVSVFRVGRFLRYRANKVNNWLRIKLIRRISRVVTINE